MVVDPSKLGEITAQTEKKYKVAFHAGSEYPKLIRIPFDSTELNMATGGGVPMHRMSRIWGHESSGKSLTTLLLAKNAQNIHLYAQELLNSEYDIVKQTAEEILEKYPDGMTVCLYDIEGSFDKIFAEKIGVDVDKLQVFPDKRIEIVGETLEAALEAAHLHIVDSTAGAVSLDELKASIAEWQRGLKARVWNKVLDRFKAAIQPDNSIVFVDQVRVDQRTGALIAPGGKKMAHESSLTIQLKKTSDLFRKEGKLVDKMPQQEKNLSDTGKAEAVGMEIGAYVTKSRVGQSHRRASMYYEKDKSKFDKLHELAKAARWLGIADEYSNGRFELPNGEKIHGSEKLKQALAEDEQLRFKVLDKINLYIAENP